MINKQNISSMLICDMKDSLIKNNGSKIEFIEIKKNKDFPIKNISLINGEKGKYIYGEIKECLMFFMFTEGKEGFLCFKNLQTGEIDITHTKKYNKINQFYTLYDYKSMRGERSLFLYGDYKDKNQYSLVGSLSYIFFKTDFSDLNTTNMNTLTRFKLINLLALYFQYNNDCYVSYDCDYDISFVKKNYRINNLMGVFIVRNIEKMIKYNLNLNEIAEVINQEIS